VCSTVTCICTCIVWLIGAMCVQEVDVETRASLNVNEYRPLLHQVSTSQSQRTCTTVIVVAVVHLAAYYMGSGDIMFLTCLSVYACRRECRGCDSLVCRCWLMELVILGDCSVWPCHKGLMMRDIWVSVNWSDCVKCPCNVVKCLMSLKSVPTYLLILQCTRLMASFPGQPG